MMNIAERTQANAPAEAQGWLERLEAALQAQDAAAAAALFKPDGMWRDLLAFTWNIETACGRQAIERMLGATLARSKPSHFHIPPGRTPPRWVSRAGQEAIECLFGFDTAFGPCSGVVRLVRDEEDPARLSAWTVNTNLQELRGHEEEFKRRGEPEFDTRLRRRQLARPAHAAARLYRPRSGRAGGGRRPCRPRHRRAAFSARRRHADRRPPSAHRRQLAHALPLADAAQRGARQPPALYAVSAHLPGLYPEGPAGELVRNLTSRAWS